jgi:hypothetical protein
MTGVMADTDQEVPDRHGLDLFFNDSDSEGGFDGFVDDDIKEVDVPLMELDLEIPHTDVDLAADRTQHWVKVNDTAVADDSDLPLIPPFTGNPGLAVDMPADSSPYDFVKLFFTEEMMRHVTDQTNVYAQQTLAARQLGPHSRLAAWSDVSIDEMKAVFSLMFTMGLVDKADIDSYWSTDEVLSTPFFPSVMSRNRFTQILSFLHVNDNSNYVARGQPGHDALFKVRPIYTQLMANFLRVYRPRQNLSIDEGIVPWSGRLKFRVYVPMKPDRFGIKAHQLCESETGYCIGTSIYTGKDYVPNRHGDAAELAKGQSHNIVFGLLRDSGLLNKGHCVYMDNYYSSPTLFDALKAEDTMACGTVRLNRKEVPKALQLKLRNPGEVWIYITGKLST